MLKRLLSRAAVEGLYCLALGRGFLRYRNPRRRRANGNRKGFNEQAWREAAVGLGAAWRPLGSGISEITLGSARTRVVDNMCALDDPVTLAVLHDKPLTHRILREQGLSVPRHLTFSLKDLAPAVRFLRAMGRECVVKPAAGTGGGAGVATGIRTRWQLARAAAAAAVYCDELMIEEQIEGDNYRLLYLDGELLDAYVRRRPAVVADGKSSVLDLVRRANEERLNHGAGVSQSLLTFDMDMRRTLAKQGLSFRSVPAKGVSVTLKTAVNENCAADNTTVMDRLCRSVIEDGSRAVKALGTRWAGIDLVTSDPGVPLEQSGGVILEVNGTPNLYFHYHKQDGCFPSATFALKRLLPGGGTNMPFRATQQLFCETRPPRTDGRPAGLPAAVILGGEANALSVSRSLAQLGVDVHMLNEPGVCCRRSRSCRWIPLTAEGTSVEDAWASFLLGPESDYLAGAVVLACSDAGIQILARHRAALQKRFLLDDSNVPAQLDMLDKLATYRHAVAAGVATPKFWVAESREQLLAIRDELVYPLIVKPRLAHRAGKQFNSKHKSATSFEQVLAACDAERAAHVDVLLMEWVPGGDDELCSYYTYIDEAGDHLFQFTKRVIRRYPTGMGPATYHVTDWMPQLVEPARALFKQAGLRGLANVEFKRDPRDGQYKIIECNARFTAANCLVTSSGFDLAAFVYRRLVGLPQPPLTHYKGGLRLWDPLVDSLAFLELRRVGQISFAKWVASLMHRQTFVYFRWTDPLPAIVRGRKMFKVLRKKKASAPACATSAAGAGPTPPVEPGRCENREMALPAVAASRS